MKAVIDTADNACIIRIYEKGGVLTDIDVVEQIEANCAYLRA